MEIEWLNASPKKGKCRKEVRISVQENHNCKYTQLVFYNNSARKISDNDDVAVGIANHRIYFKKGGSFMLRKYAAKNAMYIRLPGAKTDYVGEYDLTFDPENKAWFVGF